MKNEIIIFTIALITIILSGTLLIKNKQNKKRFIKTLIGTLIFIISFFIIIFLKLDFLIGSPILLVLLFIYINVIRKLGLKLRSKRCSKIIKANILRDLRKTVQISYIYKEKTYKGLTDENIKQINEILIQKEHLINNQILIRINPTDPQEFVTHK